MGSKYLNLIQETLKKSSLRTDVVVQGITFTLTPSSTKDEYILAEHMASLSQNQDDVFSSLQSIRARALASMICAINGEEIPDMVERDNGAKVERAIYLAEDIIQWPSVIVNSLFMVSTDFKKRVRDTVRGSVKYEWFGVDMIAEEIKEELEAEEMDKLAEEAEKEQLSVVPDSTPSPEASSFNAPQEPATPTE
ncbi:MAG: hypothetical protein WC372_12905 [Candidatus Neomarinimicrobiota bacterium]|jgi:hypothetical protein